MPEQEQGQPDGSEFVANNQLKDEGRYDEQTAATIGAAVLEQDGQNALEGAGTERYKAELAEIAEDRQRVEEGALSTKLPNQVRISIPAEAKKVRQVHGTSNDLGRISDLHDWDRRQQQDIQSAEAILSDTQAKRADQLERGRQNYDKFLAEREAMKQAAIEAGEYDDEWAQDFEDGNMTFSEYLQTGHWDPRNEAVRASYPNLESDSYRQLARVERAKTGNAEYRRELSALELPEIDSLRERKRETMQKYLNQQTDYYAELYELNPDLFATMPTKEFMGYRDELADLERPIGSLERMSNQYADVVDTIQQVLKAAEAQKDGGLATLDDDGNVASRIDHWFEPEYFQKVYVGEVVAETFFLQDVHDWNYPQDKAKEFLQWARDDVESDYGHGWLEGEGRVNETHLPYFKAEMKTFIHAVDEYFADYNKRILDVTPRELFEGFAAVVEKLKADVEGRVQQSKLDVDGLKARFAPPRENSDSA